MAYTPYDWSLGDAITDVALDHIEQGIYDVTDALETHMADDTGWLTTGMTANSGWSLSNQTYRRIGDVVHLRATVTRTGGTIGLNANGTPTAGAPTVISVLPAEITPGTYQGIGSAVGPVTAFTVESNGTVKLQATGTDGDITTGKAFQMSGTYLV